jgi:hypothetical protein
MAFASDLSLSLSRLFIFLFALIARSFMCNSSVRLSLLLHLLLIRFTHTLTSHLLPHQFFRGSDCAGMAYEFASKLGMPSAAVQRVRTVLEQHLAQYCEQHNPTVRLPDILSVLLPPAGL